MSDVSVLRETDDSKITKTFRMSKDVFEKLSESAKKTRRTKSAVIEIALLRYFENED